MDEVNPQEAAPAAPSAERVNLFVLELGRHQRRLFLYILALVPHPADAEDLLQETNIILWQKFDRFEPGTRFFSWACRIAFNKVLQYREGRGRDAAIVDERLISALAIDAESLSDELEERRQALDDCLAKLRPEDRELVSRRYALGSSGKDVAGQLGRPANSVYQSLGRIRDTLHKCISRALTVR